MEFHVKKEMIYQDVLLNLEVGEEIWLPSPYMEFFKNPTFQAIAKVTALSSCSSGIYRSAINH